MTIKKYIQNSIKFGLDAFFSPFLVVWLVILRSKSYFTKKNKIFFGLMANNNLIYVRDSLKKYGYEVYVVPWIIPKHEKGVINYDMDIESKFPKLYKNFVGNLILLYFFFFWATFKFDVFIIPFKNRLLDRTFLLSCFEFPFLQLARKKLILNPYGGDIQYPEVWEDSHDNTKKILLNAWMHDPYYSKVDSSLTKKNIRYGEKYADMIISSLEWPDYLSRIDCHFHMRIKPSNENNIASQKNKKKTIKIIHATNHPHFKGTNIIEKAITDINDPLPRCEFRVLQNTKNTEVLKQIVSADFVIDQLLAGAYGRLAIESMSLEKPVICYLRDDLKELYPSWNECPIINANISNIKEKILEVMNMSEEQRADIGAKSKAYVEKYHSPEYVGERLHAIIQKVLKL
jgi:hypothetical protein